MVETSHLNADVKYVGISLNTFLIYFNLNNQFKYIYNIFGVF
jgi:hypothetical protein